MPSHPCLTPLLDNILPAEAISQIIHLLNRCLTCNLLDCAFSRASKMRYRTMLRELCRYVSQIVKELL